ncbi:hypothetical protein ACHAWC_002169 [Mediolabrus comicus]
MITKSLLLFIFSLSTCLFQASWAFNIIGTHTSGKQALASPTRYDDNTNNSNRREFIGKIIAASSVVYHSSAAVAADEGKQSTSDAVITDKIYINLKGIPNINNEDAATSSNSRDRIVIGLFGNDAPQPVSILKQLVSPQGYKSKCKPLDTTRLLQKEQLEANKVYNACLENEDTVGVNYDYASVWRVMHDERIDLGAVSGKFVARENPTFESSNALKHDSAGVVSVRRGNDGGYGFTIFPGKKGSAAATALDEDNIVIGRVIDGIDVVERLNDMAVVKSSSLNYQALSGGPKSKNAPSRACRYGGGELYCNEFKPLRKVLIESTGTL